MVCLNIRIFHLWAVLLIAFGSITTSYAQQPNIRGDEEAPITILVFSAFACPYCAEARKALEQVQAEFPGKVNVIFKHFPLGEGQQAYLPHEAALAAAEQGKFWEMYDALFAHQADLGDSNKIETLARQLKLDMNRFDQSLAQHTGMSQIKADMGEANALKVKVTPTFYIDGYKFDGMQQASVFEMMIQNLLTAKKGSEKNFLGEIINSSKQRPTSHFIESLQKASNVQ